MRILIILSLAVAVAPLVSADPFSNTCVTNDGCYPYSQTHCNTLGGQFYPAGSDPEQYAEACTVVCCDLGGHSDEMERIVCQELGGQEGGPACEGGSGFCQNGETDCICGGQLITEEDGFCCDATVQDTAQCGDSTDPDPIGTLCGNNLRDPGEQCDGDDLGTCQATAGVPQQCTLNCRCAYDEDLYDADDDWCEPGESCETTQCNAEESTPAMQQVEAFAGELRARASWDANILEICQNNIEGFILSFSSQKENGGGCTVNTDPAARSSEVSCLEPETAYDVTVGAQYSNGVVWSDAITFTTGHPDCYEGEQRSWCKDLGEDESFSKTLYTCDENNMRTSETCSGKCYPTEFDDGTSGAACQQAVDCDLCDGSYDSFGEVRGSEPQPVIFGDTEISLRCDQLQEWPTSQGEVTFCYLDQSYSALKEYRDCSATSYCNDYASADSCSDDPCLVRGSCIWKDEGLCTAEEPEFQRCDSTNQEACEAEGSACLWQNGECRGDQEAICEYFTDQDTCTGGTDFTLDQNTNEPITRSSNQFDLQKCDWLPNDRCGKDADDDDNQDPIEFAKDFTNPETTLLLAPASIEWGADIEIPYIVSEPVKGTYASLTQGTCGAVTRPSSTVNVDVEAGVFRFTGLNSGPHCLQYYSKDLGHNMEVVRQTELNVNTAQLEITDITFQLEPWEDRGTWDVTALVTTTRQAWCTLDFIGPEGNVIGWGPLWDKQFRRVYVDQTDGQYRLDVSCELDNGASAQANRTVVLDLDARITRPVPSIGTYRSDQLAAIGIHTRDPDATCEYVDGSQRIALDRKAPQRIDGADFTLHFADPPQGSTGLHEFPVVCTFSDGIEAFGSDGDTIIYAIDETPPNTIVTYDEDGEQVAVQNVIPVGTGQATIQVSCEDQGIPGRDQQWEAGCEQTLVDRGDGFEALGLDSADSTSLAVEDGQTLRLKSIDALGNEEAPFTIQITSEDISGPDRPDFEVIG